MATFRVYFQRTTSVECYLDVEAETKEEASTKAEEATEDGDDNLIEIPESYEYDCGPTGEVKEPDEDEAA